MEHIGPQQFWLLIAVAVAAFLFGRASARGGGGNGESDEARRMRIEQAAEQAFSSLTPMAQADVDQLLTNGKLIEAIKRIREETGLGLKDAKDTADYRKRALKGASL